MFDYEDMLRVEGVHTIAGVDEVGRGPLAGPVVAAAVIFDNGVHVHGVYDSKKLSAKKRIELLPQILSAAAAFGIGVVPAARIDEINIRQASFEAMRIAVGHLSIVPEHLLVDGEAIPDFHIRQLGIVKGDQLSFSIAAASILAKVTRDRMLVDLHEQFPRYGFDRHKGYGTALHREKLRLYGPCEEHRITFLSRILSTG